MMKICFDARVIISWQTGLGNYTYNLLKHLLEIDSENEYSVLINKSLCGNHPITEIEKKNLKRQFVEIREVSVQQQFLIFTTLIREKPDLYHYPNFDLPVFQPFDSIFTVHDLTYLRNRSLYMNGRRLKNYYTKYIMILGAKKAKKIIAVSNSTRQDLIDLLKVPGEKIEVIYEAIDENLFNMNLSHRKDVLKDLLPFNDKAKYFLFLGERRPHKNIVRIIEAFEIFQKKTTDDYKLVIGGKHYSNYREPEKRVAELGLNDAVTFLGYVEKNKLFSLYKNAVCFVFASIYEGFGIPILEAMACGTPVITSNLSSMPEIAGDAALTVNPYDVNEIAEAMEKVVSDSNLQQCLITSGLNRVKNFSWENAAKQTLKIYEDIFREKK